MSGLRDAVADFLVHEAELLDDRRFADWAELFTEDGYYWAPVDPAQTDPGAGLAHFRDDRALLRVRADRLQQEGVIPQTPPSRTSRIVGNLRVLAEAPEILVRSALHVVEYRVKRGEPADDERIYAATVRHCLERRDDGFRIRWKRVDLVNAAAALRAISIPL
jgi:3-phenylpropionate/cinnamic acid dioxygenase small subunit